jgi:SNF2 family DNA or RNA helicase
VRESDRLIDLFGKHGEEEG